MLEGIDQAEYPGGQQQQHITRGLPGLALGAQQVDQREQKRETGEHQRTGDQPGGKVGPLNLVGLGVGNVAEQGSEKQRHGAGEQGRMQRSGGVAVGGEGSHTGAAPCCTTPLDGAAHKK